MPWLLPQPLIMTSSPPTPTPLSSTLMCTQSNAELRRRGSPADTDCSVCQYLPKLSPGSANLAFQIHPWAQLPRIFGEKWHRLTRMLPYRKQSCLLCSKLPPLREAHRCCLKPMDGNWSPWCPGGQIPGSRQSCSHSKEAHRGNCSVFWDCEVPESQLIPSKAGRLRPLWESLGRHVHIPYLHCSFIYSFIKFIQRIFLYYLW